MELGIPLIIVGAAIIVYAVVAQRRERAAVQEATGAADTADAPLSDVNVDRPRPAVADFHVAGEEAKVTFDVPLPAGDVDPVLADLLTNEAIEVVREKRHTLPISQVHRVVALAGRSGEPRVVGTVELEEPGSLPLEVMDIPMLQFSHLGHDPLDQQFHEGGAPAPPPTLKVDKDATLGPISAELQIPKAVDVGLRSLGIDPDTMSAPDLVLGMLKLYGYAVTDLDETTKTAIKGGETTFLRLVPHVVGDYHELDETVIRKYAADFVMADAGRGLLVTGKYGPFEIYERERREPRARFVTRERLQKFIDSLALS